jgi:hypothetical protein
MAITLAVFDTTAPPGMKFVSPEVRDELGEVVPLTIDPGSLTEPMYATASVSTRALAPGAVTSTKVATKGIAQVNIADLAVGTEQLDDGAVTGPKAGPGVMTAADNAGNDIVLRGVPLTAAQYAATASPDPNTLYFIHS